MGRRKMSDEIRKDRTLHLRLNEDEYFKIYDFAVNNDTSMADVIRKSVDFYRSYVAKNVI